MQHASILKRCKRRQFSSEDCCPACYARLAPFGSHETRQFDVCLIRGEACFGLMGTRGRAGARTASRAEGAAAHANRLKHERGRGGLRGPFPRHRVHDSRIGGAACAAQPGHQQRLARTLQWLESLGGDGSQLPVHSRIAIGELKIVIMIIKW